MRTSEEVFKRRWKAATIQIDRAGEQSVVKKGKRKSQEWKSEPTLHSYLPVMISFCIFFSHVGLNSPL